MTAKAKTKLLSLAVLSLVASAVIASAAQGVTVTLGNVVIDVTAGFSPKALPRATDAPIDLDASGRISTVDGTLPPPLRTLTFDFDKHGSVETAGLPVCARHKLTNTTVTEARAACPDAIVGTGFGKAIVQFPDAAPIPASSPLTIFNGPVRNGQQTIFGHAYTTVPAPTTFIVQATIERIHGGPYGYRVSAHIPQIAGGYGIGTYGRLKIGRKWAYRGSIHSFVNARCADGRLQAKVELSFAEGTTGHETLVLPCQVSG